MKQRCKFCQHETTDELKQISGLWGETILCRDTKICLERANKKMRMQVYVNQNIKRKMLTD